MKKGLALLLAAALLLSFTACGLLGRRPRTLATDTEPVMDEDAEILAAYQQSMRRWLDDDYDVDRIDYDLYEQLLDCIDRNDYSAYPGTRFFDGSLALGVAQTYEEFAEEYRRAQAILSDPTYVHIKTAEDFLKIADDPDGRYLLDNDINDWWGGESTVFPPIGTPEQPFTGELNGNGHKITGTLAYTGQEECMGYFGCNAGYIHDLAVGYTVYPDVNDRFYNDQKDDRTYTSVDGEGLPTEKTKYYGVLCGLNRGTIENVLIEAHASMPEFNLYPNENEAICIGLICARNEGKVSGVSVDSSGLSYRSLDKTTRAAVGLVCGEQTAQAVLENVALNDVSVSMDSWGVNEHYAPAVYAGILIGEAEGGTTVHGCVNAVNFRVGADYALADQDLRLGGLIGCVHGDLDLSNVSIDDLRVRIDARTDEDGYTPAAGAPALAAAGVIGWADGSVTLSEIRLAGVSVDAIRREGGDPGPTYAGGLVAYCGGDLKASGVTMESVMDEEIGISTPCSVDAGPEQGDGCGGGLCGFCAGRADVSDSRFTVLLSPIFHGSTLYEANVLGYVRGDAVFTSVTADCGVNELSGESNAHSLVADRESAYWLAALAGAAEGTVTAEGCVIDVHYNVIGNPRAIFDGGDEGLYNPVH